MTLTDKIKKETMPYHYLDMKPTEIESEYFFIEDPVKNEPVKSSRVNKLLSWALGCIMVVVNVKAVTEFDSTPSGLFWIFIYGFWLVLLYMTFTLKGQRGNHIGILNFLQLVFAIVIVLGFYKYSALVAIMTLGCGVAVFFGMIVGDK